MAVNYTNSFYADSHAIFGRSIGYEAPSGRWQSWLEARNLANWHYDVTVTPGHDDSGQDAARSKPGEGFGVYAGEASTSTEVRVRTTKKKAAPL